ncbi:MAG: hypothetical protein IPG96_21340, partial [Proteobacteria bacterium]|nr:hypothetical protein [Pseudomonadota bacterium]
MGASIWQDAFTRADHFRAMERRLAGLAGGPPALGPRARHGALSVRLFGDPPSNPQPVASRKVVFLGATRGMGRALARLLAERGEVLCCSVATPKTSHAARQTSRRTARRRSPVPRSVTSSNRRPSRPALDEAARVLGRLELVVVSAGDFAPQEVLEHDPALTALLLAVDFTNTLGSLLVRRPASDIARVVWRARLCVFSS